MRLEAFQIQNYKNIDDSGWVECEDLMGFVGKNEAGKTALFRALSKLNPSDKAKYDRLKEFPRQRLTVDAYAYDWAVATGRFTLDSAERKALAEVCDLLSKTKAVEVTRHYSDDVKVKFVPSPKLPHIGEEQWQESLETAKQKVQESVAPDDHADQWAEITKAICGQIDHHLSKVGTNDNGPTLEQVRAIKDVITAKAKEAWAKKILRPVLQQWDELQALLEEPARMERAEGWVVERLPYFLYFDNYGVLQSNIFIPDFLDRVSRQDRSQQTRVQHSLFKYVGVDIKQLATLGKHKPEDPVNEDIRRQIDELTIRCDAASSAMTARFKDWWEQRRHSFHYELHGSYFRIWVSDDVDPSKIELEERSAGMRYFFSFYLVFIVEAEELHRNCILLLDEPGLHLHGTAQAKLIEFLDRMSQDNQLFYSTHSPFMIDGAHLERARALSQGERGIIVSSDVWPRDRDTLFPLQAALGYSVCQSLFLSRKQVLVEGQIDYMLLIALNQRLLAEGRSGLRRDIVMVPMGGVSNLGPLASMLLGHEIEIAILLDCDPAGVGALKKMRKLLTDVDERCLQVSQFADDPDATELEDLIPESYYLEAVRQAYPDTKLDLQPPETQRHSIVDRVKESFERTGAGQFEKWRPIEVIVRDLHAGDSNVPKALLEVAERIFEKLNTTLADAT